MRRRGNSGPNRNRNSFPNNHLNFQKVSLLDLISLKELQEMQDSFSEVASVCIRTVDARGNFLTAPSNPPNLCVEPLKDNEVKEKLCGQCLPTFLGGDGIVDDDLSFECLPGLRVYLIPLKLAVTQTTSVIVGYMNVGPVIFLKRRTKEEYAHIAEKAGMELYDLWNFVLELRVFSYKTIHSFLDMIENLMGHILNLAYSKMAMQKKILSGIGAKQKEKSGGGMATSRVDEFLELFLDFIMDITQGNIGSVMLLDPNKRELSIRASRGLPFSVIRDTSVKLGEGISGLAAQTKRPFLINEDSVDESISERLKRPQLFSSIVVPIKCRDDVYGVVNVSSDRALPVRFDESTLSHLTKAAGLAGVTLEQIRI